MNLSFPAARIASHAEFEAWAQTQRAIFDQRWRYEQQEIKSGHAAFRAGTCGVCLTPTNFHCQTSADWREELNCACALGLSSRERSLLHFLRAQSGAGLGQKLALIGAETGAESKLQEWGLQVTHLPRLIAGRLAMEDASADLILCADYLQHVPPIVPLMREISRITRAGGELFLTVPFDVNASGTRSRAIDLPRTAMESALPLHLFGWDLLDLLRDLGFSQVAAHFFWSDEFGYLGPFNQIISGVRL